eukprot:CFRG7046T1
MSTDGRQIVRTFGKKKGTAVRRAKLDDGWGDVWQNINSNEVPEKENMLEINGQISSNRHPTTEYNKSEWSFTDTAGVEKDSEVSALSDKFGPSVLLTNTSGLSPPLTTPSTREAMSSFVDWSPILPIASSRNTGNKTDRQDNTVNRILDLSASACVVGASQSITREDNFIKSNHSHTLDSPFITPRGNRSSSSERSLAVVEMTPMMKSLNLSKQRQYLLKGTPMCVKSPVCLIGSDERRPYVTSTDGGLGSHGKMSTFRPNQSSGSMFGKCEEFFITTPRTGHSSSQHRFSDKRMAAPCPLQLLLKECKQDRLLSITDVIGGENALISARKVGEGSFAEVFLCDYEGELSAVKIMPFGGVRADAGDWKSSADILQEVIMTSTLSSHRGVSPNLIEVKRIGISCGPFPPRLVELWDAYDEVKDSENERPDCFDDDQTFAVFVFANGGSDLENTELKSIFQAESVIRQMAFSMAVTEDVLRFEHRDLHWGNVLVAETDLSHILYRIGDQNFEVQTHGVVVNIIDFTLSRLEVDGKLLYFDLATEEIFHGKGDPQFQVYRDMKKALHNKWDEFCPYTNVLWLKYILDKLLKHQKFGRIKRDSPEDIVRSRLRAVKSESLQKKTSLELALMLAAAD